MRQTLALINASYGLFVLPESLPRERRDVFSWKKANPVGSLTLLRSHPDLLGFAGINLLFQIAHCVLPSVFVLYTGYRYGWSSSTVGFTLMAVGVFSIIVQGGSGEAGGTAPGRTGFALYRPAVRHRRLCRFRPGTNRFLDVGIAAGVRADGSVRAGTAKSDVPARGAL